MTSRPPYFIFLGWLWLAGLLLFAAMVAWDTGLLPAVLANDQTRISVLLLILTALVSLHCAYRSYILSRYERVLRAWQKEQHSASKSFNNSPLSTYLPLMLRSDENNLSINGELLSEHFHYQHEFGWFATGTMIRLGLLGTIIGFIIMLSSIGGLDSLNIEQVQLLMQRMTQGMMVALNTTLLGLLGSLILGVQYLFLDHCADRLQLQVMTWVQNPCAQEHAC